MRPCPVSDRPLLFGYRLSAGRGGNIWRREYQMISLIIGGQQPAPPPSISPERRHRRQGSGVSISRLSLLRRHLNVERPEDIASVQAKRGTWKLPLHLPPLDQMRQSQRSPYGGGGGSLGSIEKSNPSRGVRQRENQLALPVACNARYFIRWRVRCCPLAWNIRGFWPTFESSVGVANPPGCFQGFVREKYNLPNSRFPQESVPLREKNT